MDILALSEQLKRRCAEFVETPIFSESIESISDFDALVLIVVRDVDGWSKKREITAALREAYLSTLSDDSARFRAQLHWRELPGGVGGVVGSYDAFKDLVIRVMREDASIYAMICRSVSRGELHLGVDDISHLPDGFIEYCAKHASVIIENKEKAVIDSDADDYEPPGKTPSCSCAELFLVNCLCASTENAAVTDAILARLPLVCDPRLHVLPLQCVRLEGADLLDRIHEYYATKVRLPPAIRHRRNLHLIANNNKQKMRGYAESKDAWVLSSDFNALSIEFPHMCYVYPSSVSVDACHVEKDIKLRAWTGTDVVQYNTCRCDDRGIDEVRRNRDDSVPLTHAWEERVKSPCTFIGLGLGYGALATISRPRVDGVAIVLC